MPAWINSVRYIRDEIDPVAEQGINRPLKDLDNNIRYLKDRVDSLTTGKAIISAITSCTEDVVIGTPVYLNESSVWEPALAKLKSDAVDGDWSLEDSAKVSGIAISRATGANKYNVLLSGECVLPAEFLSVISGDYSDGTLYLSTALAGKLSATRGMLGIRVCESRATVDGKYLMLFNPEAYREALTDHIHYRVILAAEPAGDNVCVPYAGDEWGLLELGGPYPGIVHEVGSPDPDIAGWLPADHTVFDGLEKPEDAKFGYNISADERLSAIWPPTPFQLLDSVVVELNGVNVTGTLCIVNQDGIWWTDDTWGNAPWPINPCGASSESSELSASSESSSDGVDVPDKNISLWMTRLTFKSSTGALSLSTSDSVVVHDTGDITKLVTVRQSSSSPAPVYVDADVDDTLETGSPSGVVYPYKFLPADELDPALIYSLTVDSTDSLEAGLVPNIELFFKLFTTAAGADTDVDDLADALQVTVFAAPEGIAGSSGDLSNTTLAVTYPLYTAHTDAVGNFEYVIFRTGTIPLKRYPGTTLFVSVKKNATAFTMGLLPPEFVSTIQAVVVSV